jgi:hypothetical protein
MASYPDDMKMMENYSNFDRNGAFSGNRGYNSMGSRNYYGSDGSYYANSGMGRGNNRGDSYYDGMRGSNSRRDREISFSGSRGYNGPYSPSGRGYDGIERYGRGQRMSSAYNGYYGGDNGGMRRMESYGNNNMGYSRSQYDFRRNGNRSGYAYADDEPYNRSRRGYMQSGIREDRPVQGFDYSSRVRENSGYGRNYRGDYYQGGMRGMRDDYVDSRMDGMGYGGYNDDYYGQGYGYDRYEGGRDTRGYGYGRSQY